MKTDGRPSAALINREWYESAREILTREELGSAVLNAIAYVLYGDELPPATSKVGIICHMVKPQLDSDIAKYQERCVRNALNAKRGASGASGSESQRVATSGEQQQHQQQQQPQQQPQCLSIDDPKQIERDKFMIWGYFWSIGSTAIKEECAAFWSYYEALGWRNNKGAAIVSRLACARMWRRQFDTREPMNGAAQWFQAFKDCPVIDYAVFNAYVGASISSEDDRVLEVRFRANEAYLADMEAQVPQCLEAFRRLCKADKVRLLPTIA